jgi:hypothetical protein
MYLLTWALYAVSASLLLGDPYFRYSDANRIIKSINQSVGIVHNAGTSFYSFNHTSDMNPTVAIRKFCIIAEVEDDTCAEFTESIKNMLLSSGLHSISIGSFIDDMIVGPVVVDVLSGLLHFQFNLEVLTTSSGDHNGRNLERTILVKLPLTVVKEAPLWQSCTDGSALLTCARMFEICRAEGVMLSSCGELIHELDVRLLRPLAGIMVPSATNGGDSERHAWIGKVDPELLSVPLGTYLGAMRHTFEWNMFYFSFTTEADSFVQVDPTTEGLSSPVQPSRLFYHSSGYGFFVADGASRMCTEHRLTTVTCARFAELLTEQFHAYYGQPNRNPPDPDKAVDESDIGHSGRVTALAKLIREKDASLAMFRYVLHRVVQLLQQRNDAATAVTDASSAVVDADFIEIGTSNFDTIVQLIGTSASQPLALLGLRGFVVEPVVSYLDSLPSIPGVEKANLAITGRANYASTASAFASSPDGDGGGGGVGESLSLYYIPLEVIEELHFPAWLRGCNSIGGYHHQHLALNITEFVSVVPIPVVPISEFLQQRGIRGVRLLKIDTEGFDILILDEYIEYLTLRYPCPVTSSQWLDTGAERGAATLDDNCVQYYPDAIIFEVNHDLMSEASLSSQKLINKFLATSMYQVITTGEDCILEKIERGATALRV